MEDIVIRKYVSQDRASVRRIAFATAFMGASGEIFFDDREILSDFLTIYFTDFEPESCFVAQAQGQVVGYLLGAKNTRALENVFGHRILAPLLLKIFLRGTFFRRKNVVFVARCFLCFLKGEFKASDNSAQYPATLHINILESFRRLHIGARLISAYVGYLEEEHVGGVCMATMSSHAGSFFNAQGFSLLHEFKRSYFQHILNKDIAVYLYGKKLS